ncbi:MAG: hypothetical protein C0512_11140, partial [Flavobacterium sp.]|nr:hypothetical protein [Flavobacterium sp.]
MKMKNFFIIASLIIISLNKINATTQRPDYLIVENDTLKLHCNPLESYFEKNPFPDDLRIFNSGLWRSYIAFFKIVNNKLVVENLYQPSYLENEKGEHYEKLVSIW